MMRKIFSILFLIPVFLIAQKPFINSITPIDGEVGEKIIISGRNLSNATQVYFGGVVTTVNVISDNIIETTVPAGASHSVLTVLTSDGLSTQSAEQFFIRFSGSDITNYRAEYLVSSGETDINSLCMCDLDGDGLNDIAAAHAYTTSSEDEITIYRNTTANTLTESFAPPSTGAGTLINNPLNNRGFISVACGDLDMDGKPDLLFTPNVGSTPNDLYIYRNNSSTGNISLSVIATNIKLPQTSEGTNRGPGRAVIADMDGDGNPDIVVGNGEDATIHIYRGNGDFTFANPDEVSVGTANSTSSLEIADFNNDGKVDIAALPFRTANEQIYILKNRSQPGRTDFELETGITSSSRRINLVSGDFDGDGLIDIAATNQDLNRVEVYRNTTSGSDINFGSAINQTISNVGVWGMDLGDMNGDGQVDLIVGSTTDQDRLHVLRNTSTNGSISFASATAIQASSTNQNVAVGDLNGDSKPDIAFTHNISLGNPGSMGVFVNENCLVPEISPTGLDFCPNAPFILEATRATGNASYSWQLIPASAGTITNGTTRTPQVQITDLGITSVSVEVTVMQDGCSESISESYTIVGGAPQPAQPSITSDSETCAGEPYDMVATAGADEYEWTLPDGSIVTTNENTLSVGNGNPTLDDNGAYFVRVRPAGGCFSELSSEFILNVRQPPLFDVINQGDDAFCAGTSVILSVPNFTTDFAYQWKRDGAIISSQTSPTLTASETGSYTVEITELPAGDGACSIETEAYNIVAVSEPTSLVNGPSETCLNFETTFTAGSTGEAGYDLTYSWQVDSDPPIVGVEEISTSFTSLGAHTVTLTTSYDPDQVDACTDVQVFNVTVSEAPDITFDQVDLTAKCQAESLTVGLTSPATGTIDSIVWQTVNAAVDTLIATNGFSGYSTFDVNTASMPFGIDTVFVVATVYTTIGCEVTDSIRIRNFPSDIGISAPSYTVSETNTVTLDEANFLTLTAENVSNVTWSSEAGDIFSAPNDLSTTVFPNQPTTLITLTGTDANGCLVSSEVTIILDNVRPRRTFSPNGDGQGFDCWEILNTSNLQGCKIYVFDARGRNILVADSPFENNCVWDGNFNGSPVPEGVYYYVLKCDDDNLSKSGSILLAR